jgi:hypothetical protein
MATQSIVDYLNSSGKPSDFTSRAGLATQYGIQNYAGTAEQNLGLLSKLQGATPSVNTPSNAINQTNVSSVPDASLLQGTNPVSVPNPITSSANNAAQGAMGATQGLNDSLQTLIDEQNKKAEEAQKAVSTSQGKVQGLLDKLAGKGAAQAKAEEEAGLAGKKELYNNLSTEYQTRQLAYNSQYQSILNQPGITREQAAQQVDELSRQHGMVLTDLGIRQAIAGNQYNTAQQLVDHKIDIEFGDLKDQIELQTKFLDDNRENLSKAEQNKLQLSISANERKYEAETTKAKDLENTKLQVLEEAHKNGADQATLKKIQESTTREGALLAAGRFLSSPETEVIKLENGSTVLINRQTGQTIKNFGGAKPTESEVVPGDNPQLYSGLTAKTATAVRSQVGNFKSEPSVQNFVTIQEGRNFANSMSNDTKNPADDQGLIYALAKALDPGSVVREGEYATAQKYSQSWIKAYGKGVEQALAGTGFLSKTARENIKKTIETKFNASKKTYDTVYNEYANGINSLTGRADGTKFLRDYRVADGTTNTSNLTDEQAYQAYLATQKQSTPVFNGTKANFSSFTK